MVPRVPRGSSLSMKSYVQYIARDVRWYIIVNPQLSYDGGLPVGFDPSNTDIIHAKIACQIKDVADNVTDIYIM